MAEACHLPDECWYEPDINAIGLAYQLLGAFDLSRLDKIAPK